LLTILSEALDKNYSKLNSGINNFINPSGFKNLNSIILTISVMNSSRIAVNYILYKDKLHIIYKPKNKLISLLIELFINN